MVNTVLIFLKIKGFFSYFLSLMAYAYPPPILVYTVTNKKNTKILCVIPIREGVKTHNSCGHVSKQGGRFF